MAILSTPERLKHGDHEFQATGQGPAFKKGRKEGRREEEKEKEGRGRKRGGRKERKAREWARRHSLLHLADLNLDFSSAAN